MDHQYIVGKNSIMEALRAGVKINKVSFQRDMKKAAISDLLTELTERQIPYNWVDRRNLDEYAENHQGVVAFIALTEYMDYSDFEEGPIVICDGITDPHNLGAIIRSAFSFGMKGLIIAKRRSASIDATVVKASAGAALHLPVSRVSNLASVVDDLKNKGYWVYGADGRAHDHIGSIDFDQKSVIIIGSEDKGISDLLKKKCDTLYKIPMGDFESLNASVAAGISFYEIFKKQQEKNRGWFFASILVYS